MRGNRGIERVECGTRDGEIIGQCFLGNLERGMWSIEVGESRAWKRGVEWDRRI